MVNKIISATNLQLGSELKPIVQSHTTTANITNGIISTRLDATLIVAETISGTSGNITSLNVTDLDVGNDASITNIITSNIYSESKLGPYIKYDSVDDVWYASNDGINTKNICSTIASELSPGFKINGISCDGKTDITVPATSSYSASFKNVANETVTYNGSAHMDVTSGVYYAATANVAASAGKLTNSISLSATGDATGTVAAIDGSSNISIALAIANATQSVRGLSTFATTAEVTAGTETGKGISPSTLKKAAAYGVPSLDSRIKIPIGQLPITISTSEPESSDGNDGDIWILTNI